MTSEAKELVVTTLLFPVLRAPTSSTIILEADTLAKACSCSFTAATALAEWEERLNLHLKSYKSSKKRSVKKNSVQNSTKATNAGDKLDQTTRARKLLSVTFKSFTNPSFHCLASARCL